MTVSPIDRIPIQISIERHSIIEGMLVRHLAPRTCDSILGLLPRESRAYLWQNLLIYFELPLVMGPEKASKFFKRGELLYWPLKGAICIALRDGVPLSQLNHIGSLVSLEDSLAAMKAGAKIRIEKKSMS